MKKTNPKGTIAKDLRSMAILLDNNFSKNISQTKNLMRAAENCNRKSEKGFWEYSFDKLEFRNINLQRKVRPQDLRDNDDTEVTLNLSVRIKGYTNSTGISDPLASLGINFSVSGEYYSEEKLKNVICSWHLDKGGEDGEEHSIHPEYHLNFGGSSMTKIRDEPYDFGNLLLLEVPRIAHAPMDAILAIDFVLQNFYTKKIHQSLTSKNGYRELVKKAQYRLWRPYYLCLAAQWNTKIKTDLDIEFQPIKLLPNLY